MTRVLIVGGAGAFGLRIAERLAKTTNAELVLGGRTRTKTEHAAQQISILTQSKVSAVTIDSHTVTPAQLDAIAPAVTINASGPFQDDDYTLARASIAYGSHYIDLADARAFVVGIDQLDDAAQRQGVLVVSGASTVPGVSSVVLAHLTAKMQSLNHIEIGISPGNHFDPGPATTHSVLKSLGQQIPTRRHGKDIDVYGWQNLRRARFGTLGKRWQGNVDVPDLALIPRHYPDVATVSVQAGTELSIQHLGLWLLSWCARLGLIKRPETMTDTLLALRRLTRTFGTNTGGMRVRASGLDRHGQQVDMVWTLTAREGHGPFIPTIATTALTKALLAGPMVQRGAVPCFDLISYDALMAEIADLSITCTISQSMR